MLGHSANQVIGNVALMGLMGIHLVCGGNYLAAKNAKSAKMIAVLRWRCFNAEAQSR